MIRELYPNALTYKKLETQPMFWAHGQVYWKRSVIISCLQWEELPLTEPSRHRTQCYIHWSRKQSLPEIKAKSDCSQPDVLQDTRAACSPVQAKRAITTSVLMFLSSLMTQSFALQYPEFWGPKSHMNYQHLEKSHHQRKSGAKASWLRSNWMVKGETTTS